MKDFSTVYIVSNTPSICENIIRNFIWTGTPFLESIEKRLEYEREYHYCNIDALRASINNKLHTILRDEKEFINFLNKQRKTVVRPVYKTAQAYIFGDYEFSGTINDLFKLLQMA